MAFISELLKTLNQEELESIRQAGLTKSERKLFEELLTQREASAELAQPDGYQRKLRSSLYDKALLAICDSDFELVEFFAAKHLHKHLTHWVGKVEKRFEKSGDMNQLRTIYLRSARLMMGARISDFDFPFMDKLEEKFASRFPDDPASPLVIRVHKLFMYVSVRREYPGKQLAVDLVAETDRLEELAQKPNDIKLNFWVLCLRLNVLSPEQSAEREEVKQQIHELLDRHREHIPIEDQVYILYEQVMYDFNASRHQEALQDMQRLFDEYPEVMMPRMNCSYMYSQLYIVNGLYDKAIETLMSAHGLSMNASGEYNATLDGAYIYFSLIELLRGDYTEAFEQLSICQRVIEKKHFFWQNALFKMLENAYFLLTEKFDLADKLAVRHIKFYNANKELPNASMLKDFHSIVRFCIRNHGREVKLGEQYVPSYRLWQSGTYAVLGGLLPKVLEGTSVVAPSLGH